MIKRIVRKVDQFVGFDVASAHCDVPCGVYDPIPAQIAAMTVARMTDTIIELEGHEVKDHNSGRDHHYQNKIVRMVNEKERSAELVKHEVRIIWGDFYKEPQFSAHPELHNMVHELMLLTSKCKQNVDQEASRLLVDKVNHFSEIFWKIKNISTYKTKYHCKPNLEIVYPDFKK